MNVPVTYAKVLAPAKKYNSEDTAYALNVFIDQASMDELDKIGINKQFAEVGKTKIAKGANRGKLKYSTEVEANAPYLEMFAAQLGRDTVKRDKNGAVVKEYAPLKLLDKAGQPFTQEVGNGSICNVKCFAYRNTDGMLVVMVDTVVVVEHVAYSRNDGEVFDDVLGIAIKTESKPASGIEDFPTEDEAPVAKKPAAKPAPQAAPAANTPADVGIDFDDDIPF
jgi:hypothetical protein